MISRYHKPVKGVVVPVLANIAAGTEIDYRGFAQGQVIVGAGIGTLTWYAAVEEDGTFAPAYDADGAAIVQTVTAGRAYPIPADLAGALILKVVADVAGTIDVSLKA
jgi:hypothetical protein